MPWYDVHMIYQAAARRRIEADNMVEAVEGAWMGEARLVIGSTELLELDEHSGMPTELGDSELGAELCEGLLARGHRIRDDFIPGVEDVTEVSEEQLQNEQLEEEQDGREPAAERRE